MFFFQYYAVLNTAILGKVHVHIRIGCKAFFFCTTKRKCHLNIGSNSAIQVGRMINRHRRGQHR